MVKPPTKKPITAIKDGICKFDKPEMAWPEVQPPAYLDPKPTNKPPKSNKTQVFGLLRAFTENNSSGFNPPLKEIPKPFKSAIVAVDKVKSAGLLKKFAAKKPPIKEPTKNIKFHFWAFQSKLKKSNFLPAPTMVHMVLKFEEKPKAFPQYKSIIIIKEIMKPEKYQGQGCVINSIIIYFMFLIKFFKHYFFVLNNTSYKVP
jgi:hypothetical protein